VTMSVENMDLVRLFFDTYCRGDYDVCTVRDGLVVRKRERRAFGGADGCRTQPLKGAWAPGDAFGAPGARG
jgi:hypothetical protein